MGRVLTGGKRTRTSYWIILIVMENMSGRFLPFWLLLFRCQSMAETILLVWPPLQVQYTLRCRQVLLKFFSS
jgi:hypothetical protein